MKPSTSQVSRLLTLKLYPHDVQLGFDHSFYMDLCRLRASVADRYRALNGPTGFGIGGRQRQRAYNDALRDLTIRAMGHPPVIRVPVLDGYGSTAYIQHRDELLQALSD